MSQLRVDPAAVHESGKQVGELAETLKGEFASSSQQIASSQSGWIGKSAAALAAKLAEWDDEAEVHHHNISGHGERFVAAAMMYGHTDEDEAQNLHSAGDAIDSSAG